MSGRAVSLIGHHHVCPRVDPGPRPHVGGPVLSSQSLVHVDGVAVAVAGARCLCVGGGEDHITGGSSLAAIDGQPVARVGDGSAHGGVLVQGNTLLFCE